MIKPKLAMIVAATINGEIGFKNSIPWKLKGDLKNFRMLTEGHPVIMGRKTLESLPGGKPLPNRINIVVTSQFDLTRPEGSLDSDYENTYCVSNLHTAIDLAERFGTEWAWFIGGARIYEEALPLVERVALTLVHKEGDYDTKINNFALPADQWVLSDIVGTSFDTNENGFPVPSHTYLDYRRK